MCCRRRASDGGQYASFKGGAGGYSANDKATKLIKASNLTTEGVTQPEPATKPSDPAFESMKIQRKNASIQRNKG